MSDKKIKPHSLEAASLELSAKKAQMLSVWRDFDPLAPLRAHPFVTVSAAGLAGAVVGSVGGKTAGKSAAVAGKFASGSVSKLLPLVMAGVRGYLKARQASQHTAQDPTATTVPTPGEPPVTHEDLAHS